MNQQIEDNLIQGLVKIFSAYGWAEDQTQTLSQRIALVSWGLRHGDAATYQTYLSKLIKDREKNNSWWPFTPIFVYGIETLLENYAEFNDLFDIPKTKSRFEIPQPKKVGNVFRDTDPGAGVIRRLHTYGKTILRYDYVQEYGLEKLTRDLHKFFPKGHIRICNDTHEPDQVRDWVWDEGVKKVTLYYPIMPIVLISTGNI